MNCKAISQAVGGKDRCFIQAIKSWCSCGDDFVHLLNYRGLRNRHIAAGIPLKVISTLSLAGS